ncbi:alkaline phosphatase family protein [Rhodanobacter sp. B05]|uniref:alkaline phosphatase family protein n=1 Tax=Rhodanobacter sp. B05 TaxID=1945859 RepID=UPI0009857EA7|nr:ectonucleotide pyrophosphatase/phosphodiesterase [Rhodanobacter sp. B05]OOG58295.1 alkaline phosphatase family protein [Rhodanobacter sp. B05]
MKFLFRLLLCAFVAGCLGCAHQPSSSTTPAEAGSSQPAPLLLISIDGYRADYLDRGLNPTLRMLADTGVRAQWMQPSFPSLTFPNHYTIVTGRYPDSHGIVDNDMVDPVLGTFSLANRKAVGDGRWWGEAEPIWADADRHGLKTATLFWPGSEAAIHGHRPDHWRAYDSKMPYDARVDQVLHWLDLPAAQRPAFLTLYFEGVDSAGHDYGPDSPQLNQALRQVDAALARLVAGLRQRGLVDHLNLIVLADHGMAATPLNQRIQLDDLIDTAHAQVVSTGAVAGIDPAPGHEAELDSDLLKAHPHMTCWKKSRIPARYHYGHNPRVPRVVCSAQVGWLIVSHRKQMLHGEKPMLGDHGYDNAAPQMRALFIAHGPAFRRRVVVPAFPNVDVYPLMTHLLGIPAAANDGSYDAVKDMLKAGI